MPLYEYECLTCGSKIEVLQRFDDPPLETCNCGDQGQVKKLVSAPAFQFKGEGWYVTDYARKDNGKDKKEAKSDGKESGERSGGKESAGKESAGKESKSPEKKSSASSKSSSAS